jgi:hypothetical protein
LFTVNTYPSTPESSDCDAIEPYESLPSTRVIPEGEVAVPVTPSAEPVPRLITVGRSRTVSPTSITPFPFPDTGGAVPSETVNT